MSKMVTVRLDEAVVHAVEAVRDQNRFPTQSDFIREAIRRLVREERRNRVRAEVQALAKDRTEMARLAELASDRLDDVAERWSRADRGEL